MTRPPRIVLAVTADKSLVLFGGFPSHLCDRGWEVHVVSSPGENLRRLEADERIQVHALSMAREPSPLRDMVSLIRWLLLLARVRPDVLSVGTPKAGLLGSLAGFLLRVPFRVYVLRGLRLESATGRHRELLRRIEQVSCRASHVVLPVSETLRDRALALRLASPSSMLVLANGSSNGVDTRRFHPTRIETGEIDALRTELGVLPGVPVIGFVGRLTRDKGLATLAEARQRLSSRDIDHQFLLVGGMDDAAADRGVDQLVTSGRPAIVTGHVHDTAAYYRLMDVLCLPSLREGFPNVVLEAASSGVPTVTTDATGAIDSVVDGETGFIARAGDGDDLAEKLEKILGLSQADRDALGRRSRDRAVEKFAQTDFWQHLEGFYRHGLATPPRTEPD